jgi:hypothetical protein
MYSRDTARRVYKQQGELNVKVGTFNFRIALSALNRPHRLYC